MKETPCASRPCGGRLVTGGGRPQGQDRDWFVEPTVFADVQNTDRLAREEVFGPVPVVIPYDGDDDAARIANDSGYEALVNHLECRSVYESSALLR